MSAEREFVNAMADDTVNRIVARWRPIETAPKDGTKVLVYANGSVYAAWWDAEFDSEWDDEIEDSRYIGAWTDDAVQSFGYEECKCYTPTHWMPLPVPPEGT